MYHPIFLQIGGFTLYTHGIMAVLGIILGSYIIYLLAKREKLDTTYLFDNVVFAVLVGIIGARVSYFIMYRDQFSSFSEIFYLWQGGMVSYGGFIPGIITFVLLLRGQKAKINKWLPISSIGFMAGLILGRIGNIFAGEYAGIATTSKYNLGGYIPVTLYECLLIVIILAVSSIIYAKNTYLKKYLFVIFILLYTSGRFIIDFWRDESKVFLHISIGQIVSLLIFIITTIILITELVKERKSNGIR